MEPFPPKPEVDLSPHGSAIALLRLAVEGTLTFSQRGQLRQEFGECLLPMKVDIIELGSVDAAFRERIEKDFVPVQLARVVA